MPWDILDHLAANSHVCSREVRGTLPEEACQGGGLRKWEKEGARSTGRQEGWVFRDPHDPHQGPPSTPTAEPQPRQGPEDPDMQSSPTDRGHFARDFVISGMPVWGN